MLFRYKAHGHLSPVGIDERAAEYLLRLKDPVAVMPQGAVYRKRFMRLRRIEPVMNRMVVTRHPTELARGTFGMVIGMSHLRRPRGPIQGSRR